MVLNIAFIIMMATALFLGSALVVSLVKSI